MSVAQLLLCAELMASTFLVQVGGEKVPMGPTGDQALAPGQFCTMSTLNI